MTRRLGILLGDSDVAKETLPPKVEIRHTIPPEFADWRQKWLSQLPELETLTAGLRQVFRRSLRVMDREVNMSWSRSPSEIVTCRFEGGRELTVLCKYAAPGEAVCGHHRGLEYEAFVYRTVLSKSPVPVPAFHGLYTDVGTGLRWIVVEYLARGTRLHKVEEPGALQSAARWIATFHAASPALCSNDEVSFFKRYDGDYYRGWARRTTESEALHSGYAWLAGLCARADEWVSRLVAAPVTVIHGEYYPDNIIVRNRDPYPVDWESAALAPGEIDLAALTGGTWPADLVSECETAYSRARWPDATPPPEFEATLAAARMYLHFRWLGEVSDERITDRVRSRLGQLQRDAEALDAHLGGSRSDNSDSAHRGGGA